MDGWVDLGDEGTYGWREEQVHGISWMARGKDEWVASGWVGRWMDK